MTARTHDLFAFTTLAAAVAFWPLPQMTLATAVTAFAAGFLGGLAPDLDEPGSALWRRLPAGSGSILGRIVAPVFGSHRFLSHSLIGLWLLGKIAKWLLERVSGVLIVDIEIVWWAFMMGAISHLIADSLTKEGVPWLWPLKWKIGFPPIQALRIKTGSWGENVLVFPGLLLTNAAIFYYYYPKFLNFFQGLV